MAWSTNDMIKWAVSVEIPLPGKYSCGESDAVEVEPDILKCIKVDRS